MKQVVGVWTIVIALGAVSGCIATKQSYVAKGNKLYAASKYEDASLNYRKAIQKDPKFGEAYYRLGLAAIKQNQGRQAYDALFRALQLLPENTDVKEKFADVCLSFYLADSSRPQVLYRQLTQLSEELLSKNGNSYEGLMLKGYLASIDKKPKEAIAFFRKALQINSSDPGVATSLARILIQDGQVQEGEQAAMDLIARQKTSFGPVYDFMYRYYSNANRAAEAENVLKAKVNNNPKQADYIVELARHYNRIQKPAEMKAALQRLLDDPKNFPEARLWVGDFYLGLRDYPEAIRFYEEGIRAHPKGKEKSFYQNKAVVALLAEEKTDEASRLVDQILAENPQDDNARRVRADLWLDSHKPENLDTALRTFQDLSAKDPNDALLHFHLGRAYRRKGDLESARAQLIDAIKISRALLEARYELVEIDLMQQKPGEALAVANEILVLRPDDRLGQLLHARALMASGDTPKAEAEFNRLIKDSPKDAEAQLQLGLLALSAKKYTVAIDILNKLRSSGEERAFPALATAYSFQGQYDKALDVLNEALKKRPDSRELIDQSGVTEALAGHYDLALGRFQKLVSLDPKSSQARRRIGEMYDVKGDHDKAIASYQQAGEMAPNNVEIAMTLADALTRAGRVAEARTKYQGIVKAQPDNVSALNNLAYLLADTGGDLDEALRLAQAALAKAPGQPAFFDTIGYIYLKKGLHDSAVQTFGNLVRKNPHAVVFRYHLGLALYEKGDRAAAKRELQAALAEHPSLDFEQRIKALLNKMT